MVASDLPGVRTVRSLLHPLSHYRALREGVSFLYQQRNLITTMARRDIGNRYAGQLLGTFWAIGHPLFQMAIMVFVFGVVFKQKIGGSYDMPRDYTIYILSGLVAWLSLAPVLASSAVAVVSNSNLIKQFIFDARVLPAKEIVTGSIVWIVSLAIVMLYTLVVYRSVPWTYVLIPVLTAIHFMTALGCAWVLSALSVFVRDIKDFVTLALAAMMYLLPVVYLPAWVPDLFRPILYLNPFSYMIWVYQDVLYFGRIEHPWAWLGASLFALFLFTSGYRLFRRLQPMFGSAL